MSTNGTNFVHDLVQMATDANKVPALEERIRELEQADGINADTIRILNGKLMEEAINYEATIAKLRYTEGQRDDAELRFLEADDGKLAAVRTMRRIIDEAKDLVKILAPEPEPVRPDYSNKWLPDVQGWMSISLDDWVANGGLTSRFVMVKPPEPVIPNVPTESGLGSREAKDHSLPATASTANQDPGGGETLGDILDQARERIERVVSFEEPNRGSLYPHSEGESANNPTAETLSGSTGEIVNSQPVTGLSDATEGDTQDPFAASTKEQSPIVSTGDVETKDTVSRLEDELWAIPSRASQYSS